MPLLREGARVGSADPKDVPPPPERFRLRRLSLLVVGIVLVVPAAALCAAAGSSHVKPPREVRLAEATATTLSLAWGDRHGANGDYAVSLDGTVVATTSEASYTFSGLTCGSSYTLGVSTLAGEDRSVPVTVVAATAPCEEPTPARTPDPPPQPPLAPKPAPTPIPPPSPSAPPESAPQDSFGDDAPPLPSDDSPDPAAMSWDGAGAFVWHEEALDPAVLGRELRANGFGWVALLVHDGLEIDAVESGWIRRFRQASGLPVGGWGVLRAEPEQEARLAHDLAARYHLDFYVADAELEYKFTNDDGQSGERLSRSGRFVSAFRALEPDLPAALSSYCRADRQDLDWRAWNAGGFVFLPQAYVNDFGDATPAACVAGATAFFPAAEVHPTIGVYRGQSTRPSPETYVDLLAEARVVGFSVYLAENAMNVRDWSVLGRGIRELGLAREPGAVDAGTTSPGDEQPVRLAKAS
jgi:hypothetical protein